MVEDDLIGGPRPIGRAARSALSFPAAARRRSAGSPVRFEAVAQGVPVLALAAVVVAAGSDRPAAELHDVGAAVGVVCIPRTRVEDPLPPAVAPGPAAHHWQAVLSNP